MEGTGVQSGVTEGIFKQIMSALHAEDEDKGIELLDATLYALKEDRAINLKLDLLNRLEFQRDLALIANNTFREVMVYLLMLQVSSNIDLLDVEEKIHANFSLYKTLQHDNLLSLLNKVENSDWRSRLSSILEKVEKAVVRIAAASKDATPTQTNPGQKTQGSQTVDTALLDKIAGYKRDISQGNGEREGFAQTKEQQKIAEDGLATVLARPVPERLWLIAEEILRHCGLTANKRKSLLPLEGKFIDLGLLKGAYPSSYISILRGIEMLAQCVNQKIKVGSQVDVEIAIEQQTDLIFGQVQLSRENQKVYGIVERNHDFMPLLDPHDQLMVNAGNELFNSAMKADGSTDGLFDAIRFSLEMIGGYTTGQEGLLRKILLNLSGAKFSHPSKATITARLPVPLRSNESSYFK